MVGFAGLLDLGYIAFFAVGAYLTGLLASPQFAALLESLINYHAGSSSDTPWCKACSARSMQAPTASICRCGLIVPLAGLTAALFGALAGRADA